MSFEKAIALLLIIFLISINILGCTDQDIKAPNGEALYEKILSKVETIYFSDSKISSAYDATFSFDDKNSFVKLLKGVKNGSWNDNNNEVHAGTFPYIFLVDIGNGDQYNIHGNDNGEIVFNYEFVNPGITDKWLKQHNMASLRRYLNVKFLVDKEQLESLVKPYKDEILKKKETGRLSF